MRGQTVSNVFHRVKKFLPWIFYHTNKEKIYKPNPNKIKVLTTNDGRDLLDITLSSKS